MPPTPDLFDPPFRFTICGLEELEGHCEAQVSHVLSILDPGWPEPSAFGAYGEHDRLELHFHDVIEDAADMQAPSPDHVEQLLAFGRTVPPENGAHLLVHCHAGISRSSAALTLLIAQAQPERDPADILSSILAVRPKIWPNLRILEFGDALLGRDGALIRAAAPIYRHQIDLRPHLVDTFRNSGRGREVDAALA